MHRLRDPVTWSNASQLVKTAAAAAIAWVLAVRVFGIAQPFLAPWAALLTVHATVYGTLQRGAQQVGASVVGVLLAFGAGQLFGVNAASIAVVVALGLLVGSVRAQRTQATTAAATALVVLTTGYSDDGGMLAARLLDTGIGIAVGLLVNLLVWPPLRDRGAAHQIGVIDDCIGELLCDVAAALRGGGEPPVDDWIARANDLDEEVDEGWSVLGQARESGRLNPRRAVPARMRATADFEGILGRLEQAVAEIRSMATTIGMAYPPPGTWGPWLDLLEATGEAVARADVAAFRAIRAELDELADDMFRPVAGALLVNLRNILEALDVVADAQPVGVPAPSALTT
jgi:Aromatic acid exporter family member 1